MAEKHRGRSVTVALAALASLLAAAVLATSLAAASEDGVLVEANIVTGELAARPHAMVLSGDGTFYLYGLRWQSFGGPTALANGRAYARGCVPYCANGKVTRPRVTVRLLDPTTWRGHKIYSRLDFVLRGRLPKGYAHRGSYSMVPGGPQG